MDGACVFKAIGATMNLEFITTKVHGYLDYASAALLPFLTRRLGASRRVRRLDAREQCPEAATPAGMAS